MFFNCQNQLNNDEDFSKQLLNDFKQNHDASTREHQQMEDRIYRLKVHLADKPPKSGVSFQFQQQAQNRRSTISGAKGQIGFPGQTNGQAQTPQQAARVLKIQKYQQKQQEAKELFIHYKDQLEQMLILPEILKKKGYKGIASDDWQNKQDQQQDKLDQRFRSATKPQNLDLESSIDIRQELSERDVPPFQIQPLPVEKINSNQPVNIEIDHSFTQESRKSEQKQQYTRQKSQSTNMLFQISKEIEEEEDVLLKENIKDKIQQFNLIQAVKKNEQVLIANYNNLMANDEILRMDFNELNIAKTALTEQLDEYNELLEEQKQIHNLDNQYKTTLNADIMPPPAWDCGCDRDPEQDQKEKEEKEIERQEEDLLREVITKKSQNITELGERDPDKDIVNENIRKYIKTQQGEVRQIYKIKDLVKDNLIDQYKAEQMRIDHKNFLTLTKQMRHQYDKLRLQCSECTNTFAYRIYLVIDAADIDYPDPEIEIILKRYQRFWPYEPLDLEAQAETRPGVTTQTSASILKFLSNQIDEKSNMTQEQYKKMVRAKRKKVQKGISEFQFQMMNSALWIAFQQKLEISLYFLHQKKFVRFLMRNIKILRQPKLFSSANFSHVRLKLLNPHRQFLQLEQFNSEYNQFMKSNKQNLKHINKIEKLEVSTPQQQVQLQQNIMMEEKHFDDFYQKNKYDISKSLKDDGKEKKKAKRNVFNASAQLHQADNGIEKIVKQVNQDKCNYSKLLSYNLQDIEFIQQFMKRANQVQSSDILQLDGQNMGSSKSTTRRRKIDTVQKSTQSRNQKLVESKSNKKPVITPTLAKDTRKPPIMIKDSAKITSLRKSAAQVKIAKFGTFGKSNSVQNLKTQGGDSGTKIGKHDKHVDASTKKSIIKKSSSQTKGTTIQISSVYNKIEEQLEEIEQNLLKKISKDRNKNSSDLVQVSDSTQNKIRIRKETKLKRPYSQGRKLSLSISGVENIKENDSAEEETRRELVEEQDEEVIMVHKPQSNNQTPNQSQDWCFVASQETGNTVNPSVNNQYHHILPNDPKQNPQFFSTMRTENILQTPDSGHPIQIGANQQMQFYQGSLMNSANSSIGSMRGNNMIGNQMQQTMDNLYYNADILPAYNNELMRQTSAECLPKATLKKIKLPSLKKNKQLNNLLKDL